MRIENEYSINTFHISSVEKNKAWYGKFSTMEIYFWIEGFLLEIFRQRFFDRYLEVKTWNEQNKVIWMSGEKKIQNIMNKALMVVVAQHAGLATEKALLAGRQKVRCGSICGQLGSL